MCERISWIELPDTTLLYLTTYDLWDTPRGKVLREQFDPEDWWGHAAIKFFHEQSIQGKYGQENECTDYSKPANFPVEIADAIKAGKFHDIAEPCMLSPASRKKCASHDKAYAAHDKACAAYRKACAAYRKACAAHDKARAAYDKACAAYDKACAAYDKARAAYDKARASSSDPFPWFWRLFASQRNRSQAWRDK